MKSPLARPFKTLTMVFAAVVIFTLAQGVARADELFISVSATGTTLPGLTFAPQPTGFQGLTTNGSLGVTLGTIAFDSNSPPAAGSTFTLSLIFDAPGGISGGNTLSFSGTVTDLGGFLLINFDNVPQTFTFSNSLGSGSFDFSMADLFILPGTPTQVFGGITNASVPEPATLALLATGLAGAAGAARRRRRLRRAPQ